MRLLTWAIVSIEVFTLRTRGGVMASRLDESCCRDYGQAELTLYFSGLLKDGASGEALVPIMDWLAVDVKWISN